MTRKFVAAQHRIAHFTTHQPRVAIGGSVLAFIILIQLVAAIALGRSI